MTANPIVIIGAGHAGVQAAAALREEGVELPIVLISNERHTPYQRPPLSKRYLQGGVEAEGIFLREPAFYARQGIDLLLEDQVLSIDRASRRITLSPSRTIPYSHLVLATGSKKRKLSEDVEGIDGIFSLRSLDDATALRIHLQKASAVVVVGAGFIGMEFAAVAAGLGCTVEVIELAERPLLRSASKIASEFFVTKYDELGIKFHFGERVQRFEHASGRVQGVRLESGGRVAADLVLIGVGASPADDLARQSGLPCANGIEVDEALRTLDPSVSAIGDCTLHPNQFAGRSLRLESVQNASDQARVVAKRLSGKDASYDSVPWFWSDLGSARLQIAGLLDQCDQYVIRGSLEESKFSIYGFVKGALAGVESVNKPADHLLARRLLSARAVVDAEKLANDPVYLKQLLAHSDVKVCHG